jgi:hypothetical protein
MRLSAKRINALTGKVGFSTNLSGFPRQELLPIPPCQIKERTGNEEFHPSRGWPGPFEKETAHERRRPKLSVL